MVEGARILSKTIMREERGAPPWVWGFKSWAEETGEGGLSTARGRTPRLGWPLADVPPSAPELPLSSRTLSYIMQVHYLATISEMMMWATGSVYS